MQGAEVFPIAFLLLFALFTLVALLGTIFWIWMLIDCATKEPSEGNDKIVWVAIILLTHLLGALIYYFARRPERIRIHGQ
jgi:hypothetical protein